jgi:PII-like signaling protein
MAHRQVTIARIYLREGEHLLSKLMKFLHDEERVFGVTVLRAISGFGKDGKIHTASLIDLSLDLPLIVEFYDEPARVDAVIQKLAQRMNLPHIVLLSAVSYTNEE